MKSINFLRHSLPILGLALLPATAHSQEISAISLNTEIAVVPAPGAVKIDGKSTDWDLSAGVWSYNNPTLVQRYSVWTHLMHDQRGIYFLARYNDRSPLQNGTRGKDFSLSWRADAYQARVILDDKTPEEHQMHLNLFYSTPEEKPYLLVKHGGFKAKPPYDGTGPDRPDLQERFGSTMEKFGGEIAFAPREDGSGYNCEAFMPWSYLRLSGKPLGTGQEFVFGIEAMWGNNDGTRLAHRLADGIKNAGVNRIFMFRARDGWGRAVIHDKGNLGITKAQEELHATRLKAFVDYDTYGSVPVKYELPEDREVTIAIENSAGKRVRNLIGQFPRKKGPNTDLWDGMDDDGKPVPAGRYNAIIVDHKPVELRLINSVYNSSAVPWYTDNGLKAWGSNHGHPTTVASNKNVLLFGFTGTEGTTGLLRADTEGNILWTSHLEILDVAIGPKFAYTLSKESWKKSTVMRRFTLDKGVMMPFEDADRSPDAILPIEGDYSTVPNVSSIAYAGGKLYVQIPGQKLFILNPATGLVEKQVAANGLQAVTDRDDALYGLYQDGSVHLLNADAASQRKLFTVPNLQKPQRLGISQDVKRFAISDGTTNQVQVVDETGKLVQSIGRAYAAEGGKRPAGKFIATDLINPMGLDFDQDGKLWVTEGAKTSKRVTRWNAAGTMEKQMWGSADYGAMSGFPLTHDSTRFIAHGVEFLLDPNPAVGTRPTQEQPLVFHPALSDSRGFVYQVNGREYAVTLPGHNKPSNFIVAMRDASGAFVPRIRVVYPRGKVAGSAWTDLNANGAEDPGETVSSVKGSNHYWSYGWMRPDLAFVTPDQWFYPVQRFTDQGVPLYDFANPVKPTNTIPVNLSAQGATGTVIMDSKGNISNGIAYATADGRSGAYPNPYGRHNAPAARRGLLIAPFRTNGVVEGVPGVGSVTALGGDRGEWFLLSMDGLYISSLLQDSKGEVNLDENFIGQESFGGFMWRDEKGRVLVQLGGPSYRIHEVLGLESTRRQTMEVNLTPAQIAAGQAIVTARQQQGPREPAKLRIARVAQLPTAAADPNGTEALIAGAEDFGVQEEGDPNRRFRAALAHDGQNLAIMYRVNDANPWKNAEGRYTHAFIGGDSVDLQLEVPGRGTIRLLAAPVGGTNTAVYWQTKAATLQNPTTYVVQTNTANASTFDVVQRVQGAEVLHEVGNTGYSVLVKVPLAALGLDKSAGATVKGSVGVIFSDASGTNRASRLYWFNKATGLVSDVPSESRLSPGNWGPITLDK